MTPRVTKDTDSSVLFGYFRSTAAYRVRIALGLKGLTAEDRHVHLRKGEQSEDAYRKINPAGLVPCWVSGDFRLAQSLAIIEYLDETHPNPPLLPPGAEARAIAREMAQVICCDIHPIGNLRVLERLNAIGVSDAERTAWSQHWIRIGFETIEARLSQMPGPLAFADQPTLADVCIVPQVFNARRFGVELTSFPRIRGIDRAAAEIEAFAAAEPARQPDAE